MSKLSLISVSFSLHVKVKYSIACRALETSLQALALVCTHSIVSFLFLIILILTTPNS